MAAGKPPKKEAVAGKAGQPAKAKRPQKSEKQQAPSAEAPAKAPAECAEIDLDLVSRVHLFPIRHHSPRSSAALRAFLEQVAPKCILVEAPSDAESLFETLVDKDTKPPVAILGYRSDGTPDSALWPFASYSPEHLAMCWAKAHQVPCKFIDLQIGQALAAHGTPILGGHNLDEVEEEEDPDKEQEQGPEDNQQSLESAPGPSLYRQLAERHGYRSFEEFWEAMFEAPAYAPEQFQKALLSYADLVRADAPRPYDLARDSLMALHISRVCRQVPPEQVAVVLGAAHAAALAAKDVDPLRLALLPAPVPSAMTLIPYSYPRLAEQTGYGAGNRAPQYYQRAHEAGCDYKRATLEVLVEFTEHLRLRGFSASLADTIEAYRLAVMLAQLRDKHEPGLDEIREATIATLCRGEAQHVDGFLWPSVVGKRVGSLPKSVGKNSLQEEFWREVRARNLPQDDEVQPFTLQLTDEEQIASSTFLHRLRVADVPYAGYQGSFAAQGTAGKIELREGETAGGSAALIRKREKWSAGWTPATETALVEKIVLGDTLEQVARRELEESLMDTETTFQAAEVLSEAIVCRCPILIGHALSECEERAMRDEDVPSLAKACLVFSGLASYGSVRLDLDKTQENLAKGAKGVLAALCQKTFDRAVLRVTFACTGGDEGVKPVLDALKILHEIALSQPLADKNLWLKTATDLSQSYAVNPLASGFASALLFQSQIIDDAALALVVGQRLSNSLEPLPASAFLEGFFQVNKVALCRNRTVVQALDAFLNGIDPGRFRDTLPLLRRVFGPLGATERRYLLENLISLRQIGTAQRAAKAILVEKDKETLKAMDQELAQAMDDLDDLL